MSLTTDTAFYLKYRPQKLDELVGQDHIKKLLWSAFENNKLSHAYLLVGPRGTGKTSTARILAKMVNCELVGDSSTVSSKSDERSKMNDQQIPCNKCSACLSITDGSNLDLIEIDAASNRGIEDIRSLREKIKLAPTAAKKKVYIIDEVHMLTTEAFNALLKTLEEPPSHTLFILATTDVSKVPQTILSRVQRLDFKLAKQNELYETLRKISEKEKIQIDEESLKLLAKKADGSFRDGVKLLDQISTIQGKITSSIVEEALRSTKLDELLDLVNLISSNQTKHALMVISKQQELGVDLKTVGISLLEILRNLMLIKNGLGENLVEPQYLEEKYELLKKISEKFDDNKLMKSLEILQKALEQLKFASIQSLPLELAILEICGEETNKTIEDRQIEDSTLNMEDIKIEKVDKEQINSQPSILKDPPSTIHLSSKQDETVISEDILKLKEKWTFVLETIRPTNFSLEALLRSVVISQCSEETVVLEVPYSFHQRILESPKNRDLLESILSDILGRQVKIATSLGARPKKEEDIANIEVAADDEIIRIASEIFNSDTVN